MAILVFAGSSRQQSFNKKIAKVATDTVKQLGVEATYVDLESYNMPIFCEDLEAQGTPEGVLKFKQDLFAHEGYIIVTPEYNSSYSALLKNAIDWASRPAEGEIDLQAFKQKPIAIMAASPGRLGGIRVLAALRLLLGNLQAHVMPTQLGISAVDKQLDDAGALQSDFIQGQIKQIAQELIDFIAAQQ